MVSRVVSVSSMTIPIRLTPVVIMSRTVGRYWILRNGVKVEGGDDPVPLVAARLRELREGDGEGRYQVQWRKP